MKKTEIAVRDPPHRARPVACLSESTRADEFRRRPNRTVPPGRPLLRRENLVACRRIAARCAFAAEKRRRCEYFFGPASVGAHSCNLPRKNTRRRAVQTNCFAAHGFLTFS